MAIILENALLVDFEPPEVAAGALRIEGQTITHRGESVERGPGDETIDCRGCIVMPGLINGHTHLYSALAVGMPPPREAPRSFTEILERIWWRLDKALTPELISASARAGALDAIRHGVTTLIDHHSSPNCIAGSLDLIEAALDELGLRGVLCYETTDRNGPEGAAAGLEENRRFLTRHYERQSRRFAGLVGAHASFTLEPETLNALADLCREFDRGIHMHLAEDGCDEDDCQQRFQTLLIDHLAGHGLLSPLPAIFAHCVHLDPDALTRLAGAGGARLAHCPRSNMNNGVGVLPLAATNLPCLLGTDGDSSDMFLEARLAALVASHEGLSLAPQHVLRRLATAAELVSELLDEPLGRLAPGFAADVVITDYQPPTPLEAGNLAGHFLYALSARNVKDVIAAGRWLMRDRQLVCCDESAEQERSRQAAAQLWQRMEDR